MEVNRASRQVDRQRHAANEEIISGQPVCLAARNAEMRVFHADGIEDAVLQEAVEALPADDFDHAAEQVETHRIAPARARLAHQRQFGKPIGECLQAGRGGERAEELARNGRIAEPSRIDAFAHIGIADRPLLDYAVAKAGSVREQVADRDRARCRLQIVRRDRPIVRFLHLHVAKSGQYLVHRLVEFEQAFVHADHRRHAGDRLRHRIDAIDRIRSDRAAAVERPVAASDVVGLALAEAQRRHHSGDLAPFNVSPHESRHLRPARRSIGLLCQGHVGKRQGAGDRSRAKERSGMQRVAAVQRHGKWRNRGRTRHGQADPSLVFCACRDSRGRHDDKVANGHCVIYL